MKRNSMGKRNLAADRVSIPGYWKERKLNVERNLADEYLPAFWKETKLHAENFKLGTKLGSRVACL